MQQNLVQLPVLFKTYPPITISPSEEAKDELINLIRNIRTDMKNDGHKCGALESTKSPAERVEFFQLKLQTEDAHWIELRLRCHDLYLLAVHSTATETLARERGVDRDRLWVELALNGHVFPDAARIGYGGSYGALNFSGVKQTNFHSLRDAVRTISCDSRVDKWKHHLCLLVHVLCETVRFSGFEDKIKENYLNDVMNYDLRARKENYFTNWSRISGYLWRDHDGVQEIQVGNIINPDTYEPADLELLKQLVGMVKYRV